MSSTMGGDDPSHDLTEEEKDREEEKLRREARSLLGAGKKKERNRLLNRANEISREKARRSHRGTD